jgi:acyl-[acyl-carrier-protein] desaturase
MIRYDACIAQTSPILPKPSVNRLSISPSSSKDSIPAHLEVLRGLDAFVGDHLSLLVKIEDAWQPTDFLPDFSKDGWESDLTTLREAAKNLDDGILVVLVGGMVTEEALPSYSMALQGITGDRTATSNKPWAVWTRGWTAEENRHGDLLNAYLRLSGRVDMRAIEVTVNHLISSGFEPDAGGDPYHSLIYTSFQERATRISHQTVGKIAVKQGDSALNRICNRIAGDEARHETFYTKVMGEVFDQHPDGAVISFASMMRKMIVMPGAEMFDGKDPDLFEHFSAVAQRMGVYTVDDYGQIISHLLDKWRVAGRALSGAAAQAQDYLCRQADRYTKLAERVRKTLVSQPTIEFAWLNNRTA